MAFLGGFLEETTIRREHKHMVSSVIIINYDNNTKNKTGIHVGIYLKSMWCSGIYVVGFV